MQLFITLQAEIDLIEIWQFIANDNPSAATRLLKDLDNRTKSLLANPELGVARPDIRKNYRHLIHVNYLILYRIIPEGIEIVRYLHGARDLRSI